MKAEAVSDEEKELANTLQQLNRKYILPGSNVRQGNFKKWLAAAAAILVIVLGTVYILTNKKTTPEKLYAGYAEHTAIKIQLRGNTADSLAGLAADKFNNKQYGEALPLLQAYVKQRPDDIQMHISLGICYLEMNRFTDAEQIFSMIASGKTAYAETASWYLALTALKQKDIEKCRSILNRIPQTSTWYNKARSLLEELPV